MPEVGASERMPDATAREAAPDAAAELESIAPEEASELLFSVSQEGICPSNVDPKDRIVCLLRARYAADPRAQDIAGTLFGRHNIVAGVETARTFEGGYRGNIPVIPSLPTGADRKHLGWTLSAMDRIGAFLGRIAEAKGVPLFRFRGVRVRFFASVGKTTPSAYAQAWTISYNTRGALNRSAEAVEETLFHELFHLNDAWQGNFSDELQDVYGKIVTRCGERTPCLAPYAPGKTIVRGGTYYPFHKGNGAGEYGAELASRYYLEVTATLRGTPPAKPFRCGPPENAEAWNKLRAKFFADYDPIPPCPR